MLDPIDILSDGFRIRSHNLHVRLPEIVIKNRGDTFEDNEQLAIAACKQVAISRLRDQIVCFLPGCWLMPPTRFDKKAIVGPRACPYTRLAEGNDFLAAHHEPHGQIVR